MPTFEQWVEGLKAERRPNLADNVQRAEQWLAQLQAAPEDLRSITGEVIPAAQRIAEAQAELDQARRAVETNEPVLPDEPTLRTIYQVQTRPWVRMSQPQAGPSVVDLWRTLAADDSEFQLGPEPTVKAPRELARHYSQPQQRLTVAATKPTDPRASKAWQVKVEGGGTATMMQSPQGHVWLDTSGLESDQTKSGGGAPVYQLAASYAQNNGLRFRSDPRGLSPKAKTRRISQMISSVLRHGTDRHLDLLTPDDFGNVELSNFQPGQTDANLQALLQREYADTRAAGLQAAGVDIDQLTFDPESNTIRDERTGATLTRGAFESLAAGFDPARTGVGKTTLLRAVVTGSAARAQKSGGGSQWHERLSRLHRNRAKAGVSGAETRGSVRRPKTNDLQGRFAELEALAEAQPGRQTQGDPAQDVFRPVSADRRLLYSQPGSRAGASVGVSTERAQEALRTLQRTAPELARGVRMVPNRDSLNKDDYHPDDWADLETAEAFFHPATVEVVVLTDNVARREGETPVRAVLRALLHEQIGHAGLAALRQQKDKSFARRWDRLVEGTLRRAGTGGGDQCHRQGTGV